MSCINKYNKPPVESNNNQSNDITDISECKKTLKHILYLSIAIFLIIIIK